MLSATLALLFRSIFNEIRTNTRKFSGFIRRSFCRNYHKMGITVTIRSQMKKLTSNTSCIIYRCTFFPHFKWTCIGFHINIYILQFLPCFSFCNNSLIIQLNRLKLVMLAGYCWIKMCSIFHCIPWQKFITLIWTINCIKFIKHATFSNRSIYRMQWNDVDIPLIVKYRL